MPEHATVRILSAEEWHKLAELPIGATGIPDPERCHILVAETPDGEIVGTWALVTVPFLEGLWVKEEYREHSSIAGRLLSTMKSLLHSLGIFQSFTLVQDVPVLILAHKAGFERLPGDLMMLITPPEEKL